MDEDGFHHKDTKGKEDLMRDPLCLGASYVVQSFLSFAIRAYGLWIA